MTGKVHPTQKPVALLEYLIKTYTLEGETVLDNTMGSGSTGVACINTKRQFIGIEKDDTYFEIAKERIEDAIKDNETKLFWTTAKRRNKPVQLIHGDCLEKMKDIPDKSIDMILCDLQLDILIVI